MVVLRLRAHLPLLDLATASLGLDAVLGGEVFGEEQMRLRASPPKGERPLVAERGEDAACDKALPVVRVEDDVPDGPLATDVRHPPVVADAVADRLLVLAHRLRACADVLAVRRDDDVRKRRLAAELVHDVGRLSPVRVHKALLDPHRRTVVAGELAGEIVLGKRLEPAVKAPFKAGTRELRLQGRIRLAQGEVPPPLVGPRPVVDHVAGEVIVPGAHDVKEQRLLHVDEHRDMVRRDGNRPLGVSVQLVHDSVDGQLLVRPQVLGERLVLVLSPERRLVGELQVHRMLDRRDLVVVVAVGPRHDRPLVHLRPMLPVKLGRPLERPALA